MGAAFLVNKALYGASVGLDYDQQEAGGGRRTLGQWGSEVITAFQDGAVSSLWSHPGEFHTSGQLYSGIRAG